MDGLRLPANLRTRSFTLAIVVMGFSGMLAQIILLRELLVAFLGNELSIGIILANWLILEALGSFFWGQTIEHKKEKLGHFILATLIFSLTLPVSLYLCRGIKGIFGLSPGEGLGALRMLIFSFLALLPVSFSHGALFTFSCKVYSGLSGSEAPSAGKVYIFEVLGTALGGILFTYALLPFFHSFQIVFGVAALNLLVCLFLLKPLAGSRLSFKLLGLFILTSLCLTIFLFLSAKPEDLHWSSIKRQWGNLEVIHYENSPYGNITVTKRGEQYDFFSDGVSIITIPTPDIAFTEDFAHFPLLFHPDPEDVLVISGGAGGIIREIEKHRVKRIDYVELDPLLLEVLEKFSPPQVKAEWLKPLVKIHHTDGRRYLREADRRYDLILVGLSNPGDLQLNRFFTIEFFNLVKEKLKKEGILLLTLPGSLTYLNEELKSLNACIWRTLQEVFTFVRILPGEVNLMLASESLDISAVTPDLLSARLSERRLEVKLITPFYINYRLQERKREWLMDSLKDTRIELNKDFSPSGVFYSLSLWNARFSPRLQKLFLRFSRLKAVHFLFLGLFLILIFLFLRPLLAGKLLNICLPFTVATSGFSGLLFDLSIVFSFQVLYGYVYHRIGLIITAFMIGTGLGAALITFSLEKVRKQLRLLLSLETGIILFSIILPAIFLIILPRLEETRILPGLEILFYGLSLAGGALIGAEFPLAMKIFLKRGANFSKRVGLLNASDLVGGWLGGILGGVILLPILGLEQSCTVLVLLKATALILLLLSLKALKSG